MGSVQNSVSQFVKQQFFAHQFGAFLVAQRVPVISVNFYADGFLVMTQTGYSLFKITEFDDQPAAFEVEIAVTKGGFLLKSIHVLLEITADPVFGKVPARKKCRCGSNEENISEVFIHNG